MKKIINQIEANLKNNGEATSLDKSGLNYFPENLTALHSYRIFGENLLAIPNSEDEEYEKTFSFLSCQEQIDIFESEFRELIPKPFFPFGYLYGASEIVLLDSVKNSVHTFHVSDVCDVDWLKYQLNNEISSFLNFIESIRVQSVTCLINPKDYSECLMLEIRDVNKIYCNHELQRPTQDPWNEYYEICNSYLEKGFELHYAPRKVKLALNQ